MVTSYAVRSMTFDEPPHPEELSTLLRAKFDPSPQDEAVFVVVVVEGPDKGRSLTLDAALPTPVLIGVGPACELRLSDRHVSRRHATLEVVGERLRLSDLDSTNGTSVNGFAAVEGYLRGGELVRLGETTLAVERRSRTPAIPLPAASRFGRMIGASTEMRRLYPLCARLAAATVPLIIEGETGTGKEVLAESLHEMGPRSSGPFVVFDCTAVAPNLVESELFGHERGAFTGSIATHKGVFEQAHGGTLLIDEIGDLDLALQPKLLRVLERSEVRRVGGDRTIPFDVRLLCATRRDLDREVQRNRFRDDLFHRVAVTRVELPPLRRRRGDVALLARHFCHQLGVDEGALSLELLLRWDDCRWPGNVRELRNAVARTIALGEILSTEATKSAPERERSADAAAASDATEQILAMDLPLIQARQRVVEAFEQRYLERVLALHDGHVARAAAASGIARRHFQRLRARYR